jgi:uncharacterized Tic20 family protein
MATKTTTKSTKTTVNSTKQTEDRTLQIITHLLGLFLGFLGPIIILLVSKDKDVKNHAKTALNWQITVTVIGVILFVVLFTIAIISAILSTINPAFMVVYFITFFLIWVPLMIMGLANLAFSIIAAIKAKDGILWKYPFSIPLLKTE